MDKRFFLFLAISMFILVGSQAILDRFFPPPEVRQVEQKSNNIAPADSAESEQKAQVVPKSAEPSRTVPTESTVEEKDRTPSPDTDSGSESLKTAAVETAEVSYPLRYIGLGSIDPKSNSRALVTLSSYGGTIVRLELNSEQYQDIQYRQGYLGHLIGSSHPQGWEVQFVGKGTPAEKAGVQVGDIIHRASLGATESTVGQFADLEKLLEESTLGDQLQLNIIRNGQPLDLLTVHLTPRPLEMMRPEEESEPLEDFQPGLHDAFSLLLTLNQIDGEEKLPREQAIAGAELSNVHWNVTHQGPLEVEFELPLPVHDLVVTKRFQLAEVPESEQNNPDFKAYHLTVQLGIKNTREAKRKIAYLLDGPTGMPTEGWWYSRKIGRSWGGVGLRDVAAHSLFDGPNLINTTQIVKDADANENAAVNLQVSSGEANPLAYLGVETQYFAAVLIPLIEDGGVQNFRSYAGRVVKDRQPEKNKLYLTNVTSQLSSLTQTIEPGGILRQKFQFFTGPKKRSLLKQYDVPGFPKPVNLSELIYYGWAIWGFFARPLTDILHFFYSIIPNYGVAIILLTILVRLCMSPLTRKMAVNAQKMQELQPEIKKITEKYKGEMEKRSKALQELYRKHHYNPLAGCLPLFIQFPIFIGLYRALMTDVALRQAPLVSKSFPWADNLAAPDMLMRWDHLIPIPFLTSFTGWLGPYLNILPLVTVFLFILQQKMFMPPATDEQSAMQQKIMKYMMIFMGFLFFKMPSGLCLYFIVSTLWGLGERKLLPKAKSPAVALAGAVTAESGGRSASTDGSGRSSAAQGRKKKRRKK